jgi:hypothetical protein
MPPVVLTVGHSIHPLNHFLTLLAQHGIEALVDIRRFPGSRKHPHFSRDSLAAALPQAGVEYHWLEALGGRRHSQQDESPNLGLENPGFRNYADYMLTDEFREGVKALLEVARRKRTAITCAEGLFWQCHRRLVSDLLVGKGVMVRHIMPGGELRPHTLTSGAGDRGWASELPRGKVALPLSRSSQPGKPPPLAKEPKALKAQETRHEKADDANPGRNIPTVDHHIPAPDEAKQMRQGDQEENDARRDGVASGIHGLSPPFFHYPWRVAGRARLLSHRRKWRFR